MPRRGGTRAFFEGVKSYRAVAQDVSRQTITERIGANGSVTITGAGEITSLVLAADELAGTSARWDTAAIVAALNAAQSERRRRLAPAIDAMQGVRTPLLMGRILRRVVGSPTCSLPGATFAGRNTEGTAEAIVGADGTLISLNLADSLLPDDLCESTLAALREAFAARRADQMRRLPGRLTSLADRAGGRSWPDGRQ